MHFSVQRCVVVLLDLSVSCSGDQIWLRRVLQADQSIDPFLLLSDLSVSREVQLINRSILLSIQAQVSVDLLI